MTEDIQIDDKGLFNFQEIKQCAIIMNKSMEVEKTQLWRISKIVKWFMYDDSKSSKYSNSTAVEMKCT